MACEQRPATTRLKLKHGGGWVPLADGDGRALFQSVPLAALAHQTRARLRAARSRELPPPVDYAAFSFAPPPARKGRKGKGKGKAHHRRAAARKEQRRSSAVSVQRSFRRARVHRAAATSAAVATIRERAAARAVQTILRRNSLRSRARRAVAAAAAAQCARTAAVAALAAAARATAARRVAKRALRITRHSPARATVHAETTAPRSPLRGPVPRLTIDLSGAEYPIVHIASELLRWHVVGPGGAAPAHARNGTRRRIDIVWSASPLGEAEVRALRRAQREDEHGALPPRRNRFPQNALARKCDLFDMLMRAKQRHPKHFRFVPMSWTLPRQLASLRRYWVGQRASALGEALIIKPTSLSRGRGIFITKSVPTLLYPSAVSAASAKVLRQDAAATNGIRADRQTLAQRYVGKPFTIDGYKVSSFVYLNFMRILFSFFFFPFSTRGAA